MLEAQHLNTQKPLRILQSNKTERVRRTSVHFLGKFLIRKRILSIQIPRTTHVILFNTLSCIFLTALGPKHYSSGGSVQFLFLHATSYHGLPLWGLHISTNMHNLRRTVQNMPYLSNCANISSNMTIALTLGHINSNILPLRHIIFGFFKWIFLKIGIRKKHLTEEQHSEILVQYQNWFRQWRALTFWKFLKIGYVVNPINAQCYMYRTPLKQKKKRMNKAKTKTIMKKRKKFRR